MINAHQFHLLEIRSNGQDGHHSALHLPLLRRRTTATQPWVDRRHSDIPRFANSTSCAASSSFKELRQHT